MVCRVKAHLVACLRAQSPDVDAQQQRYEERLWEFERFF